MPAGKDVRKKFQAEPQPDHVRPPDPGAKAIPAITSADQLVYAADLIAELRDMAHKGGLATLSQLLELARTEAVEQSARLAQQRRQAASGG